MFTVKCAVSLRSSMALPSVACLALRPNLPKAALTPVPGRSALPSRSAFACANYFLGRICLINDPPPPRQAQSVLEIHERCVAPMLQAQPSLFIYLGGLGGPYGSLSRPCVAVMADEQNDDITGPSSCGAASSTKQFLARFQQPVYCARLVAEKPVLSEEAAARQSAAHHPAQIT